MRCIFVVLLALAASVGASSAVMESNVATGRVLMDRPSRGMATKRSLRTETLPAEDEERARFKEIVQKLKNLVKPKKVPNVAPAVVKESQQVQTLVKGGANLPGDLPKMLKAQTSTDEVVSVLRIKYGDMNLFRKDGLPAYVRYSELLSKQTGTKDIYGIGSLRKEFTDIELSAIINTGMKSTDKLTAATADRLRAGQFGNWLRERKEPREVFQLLKSGTKTISEADRVNWRAYLDKFNKLPKE